jgi:hypothetical protein
MYNLRITKCVEILISITQCQLIIEDIVLILISTLAKNIIPSFQNEILICYEKMIFEIKIIKLLLYKYFHNY